MASAVRSLGLTATLTNKASELIRPLQSGQIQMYVWIYLIGALLLGGVTVLCLI